MSDETTLACAECDSARLRHRHTGTSSTRDTGAPSDYVCEDCGWAGRPVERPYRRATGKSGAGVLSEAGFDHLADVSIAVTDGGIKIDAGPCQSCSNAPARYRRRDDDTGEFQLVCDDCVNGGDEPKLVTDDGVPTEPDADPLVVVRDPEADGGSRSESYDRAYVTETGTLVAWSESPEGVERIEWSPSEWLELREWYDDDDAEVRPL